MFVLVANGVDFYRAIWLFLADDVRQVPESNALPPVAITTAHCSVIFRTNERPLLENYCTRTVLHDGHRGHDLRRVRYPTVWSGYVSTIVHNRHFTVL